ncbi:MAG: formate dehydrogenase beta subunit [Thermodesulfobacteriota bacterium]|nr:formate dehydrogenase beta subunit [Thermodesulfobacteriota bacterium]
MKKIRAGRWGKNIVHALETHPEAYTHEEAFPSPTHFSDDVVAVMSGKGFLQFEEDFDFVPMIAEYVRQIQAKYCCGKCITGIKGSKLILATLDRIMDGKGGAGDLAILMNMADVLNDAAKCSVCQSAGELLADGLTYYRDHFEKALEKGVAEKPVAYLGSISAPCMNACPCRIDIPGYVEMLQELRYAEALAIIREEMPFPGITGRICPAPCEKACSIANMGDEAIPIRTLKRVAADYEHIHHIEPPLEKIDLTGAAVAIIGAGPAGLSAAYYLNRLGHIVTVYEDLPNSGGMVAVGIPPYRQPRDVMNREIDILRNLGILVDHGRLGREFTIHSLFEKGFKAVLLAVGSHKSTSLGLNGEEEHREGFISGGIDFLRDINLGREVSLGDHTVIVGGGNTAIDCARTCIRMGASKVSVIYRRSMEEMPADPMEVEDAREEGVEFHFLTQPVAILHHQGKVCGLRCIRMELAESDKSGRRRPVPIEGSDFDFLADTVIPAIGQSSNLSFLSPEDGVEITRRETIKVDPHTMMTSRPGLFAAGDAVSGPLTVVHAIAGGKRAAKMMHRYLVDGTCSRSGTEWMEDLIAEIERDHGTLVTARTPGRTPSQSVRSKLDIQERISSFREVDSGLTQKSSFIEASRCLRCFHLILCALKDSSAQRPRGHNSSDQRSED